MTSFADAQELIETDGEPELCPCGKGYVGHVIHSGDELPQWDRKDHNRIARILKNTKPKEYETTRELMCQPAIDQQWDKMIEEFTSTFETDSPYFNKAQFLKNCGYNAEEV